MPRIITANPTNITQGHCFLPTAPAVGSPTVFAENIPVVRVGDAYLPHVPSCTLPPTTHAVIPIVGSPNVFINGISVVRDGDPMGCGDVANGGVRNIFVNGGGSNVGEDPDNTRGYTRGIPSLIYPSNIITINYWVYIVNGQELFGAGCDFVFPLLDAFTPIEEEETKQIYRNRPGPPLTQRSGADLPSYANNLARQPIPITIGMSGSLPQNVNFYNDGSIQGRIVVPAEIELFQGKEIIIRAENQIGFKNYTFSFNFKKNYNYCP